MFVDLNPSKANIFECYKYLAIFYNLDKALTTLWQSEGLRHKGHIVLGGL